MERSRLLQNGATAEESGALLVAGDYSPHAFSQGDGAAIQTDSSKIRPHAHALQQHRPARSVSPVRTVRHTTIVSFMPAQSANVPSASPRRGGGSEIDKQVKEAIGRRATRCAGLRYPS